jgi:hypothetical protein
MEHWQQELTQCIRTIDQLEQYLPISNREALKVVLKNMRLSITPHTLKLIDFADPNDPILLMTVPQEAELRMTPEEMIDPIGDETKSPIPFLTHRYADRVLVYASFSCSAYCRFCFRHDPLFKSMLGCGHCGGVITWQCQKGRYYGSCQRHRQECKGHRLLREDRLEESLLTRLDELDASSDGLALLHALTDVLQSRGRPYIGQHRQLVMKTIEQQLRRLERMEDCLYDDRLAGLVSDEKYKQKLEHLHNEINYLRIRLSRLEEVEKGISILTEKPTSLRELYNGESRVGRRIIMRELFVMTVLDGHVEFATLRK